MQDLGSGKTAERPVRLGGALVTIVEPHRGHEVAYNRWYERDHFYAGCMIGAWNISGARFVATKDLKALRYPADSPVIPDLATGSYLALYWVLAGKFGQWMQWGSEQVKWLHDNDRMFEERDHIHTLMYKFRTEFREPTLVGPRGGEVVVDEPELAEAVLGGVGLHPLGGIGRERDRRELGAHDTRQLARAEPGINVIEGATL